MRYAHLISRFTGSFWLVREESLVAVAQLLEARISGSPLPIAPPVPAADSEDESPFSPIEQEQLAQSGVALIDVSGMLGKHLSMMETACGGCDYDAVANQLEAALAAPVARAVVLRFDSVGGQVVGCGETAARIAQLCAASDKPVVAFTDTECCSAAYWLAAACDAVYATPSAIMGSTGTKLVLRDISEKNAAEGVKFHVFKSGSMKDIMASYRPPSEEEAKLLQARSDQIAAEFKASVLAQRKVADEVFTTAMFYSGAEAQRLGLIDQVVADLREVVALF